MDLVHSSQYAILIPIYNAGNLFETLLSRLHKVITSDAGRTYTLMLVDDGSTPPVREIKMPGIKVQQLRHEKNRGKGVALTGGFSYLLNNTTVDAIITLDADMQHPPEKIPDLIAAFEKKSGEIIIGSRTRDPQKMPFHRILSNMLTSKIISAVIGQRVADSQSGFRLYSRKVLENIVAVEKRFHFESEFLIRSGWKGYRIAAVPIPTIYNNSVSAIRNLPDTISFVGVIIRLLIARVRGNV